MWITLWIKGIILAGNRHKTCIKCGLWIKKLTEKAKLMKYIDFLQNLLVCVYLGICAVQDYRSRRISLTASAAAGTAGLILAVIRFLSSVSGGSLEILETCLTQAAGLLPGALLLILSFAAGGSAGAGDGIGFLVIGILLNAQKTWILFMSSLVLASFFGIVLMTLKRACRKTKLPFMTITAAGWALLLTAHLI